VALSLLLCARTSGAKCDAAAFGVAVDAGHSRAHPGARSARGLDEYLFNRALAHRLRAVLQRRGFARVFLINEAGADVELADRTTEARTRGAALFISLHHDSVQERYLIAWNPRGVPERYSDRFSGYSLFVAEQNPEHVASLELARRVGRELEESAFVPSLHHTEAIDGERRTLLDPKLGIYRFDELIVLKTASMPALLIETGIIVNRVDEILLGNAAYQEAFVRAVARAVAGYCAAHPRLAPATGAAG
jgi:N-acetylmuramoyl-L-alanine amidase